MSDQIHCSLFYKEEHYSLPLLPKITLDIKKEFGIDTHIPTHYGGSENQTFEVIDDTLYLMTVKCFDKEVRETTEDRKKDYRIKRINGKSPDKIFFNGNSYYDLIYLDLKKHVTFTGSQIIRKDLISILHTYGDFFKDWKYEIVLELHFQNGVLTHVDDLSEKIRWEREKNVCEQLYLDCKNGFERKNFETYYEDVIRDKSFDDLFF